METASPAFLEPEISKCGVLLSIFPVRESVFFGGGMLAGLGNTDHLSEEIKEELNSLIYSKEDRAISDVFLSNSLIQ